MQKKKIMIPLEGGDVSTQSDYYCAFDIWCFENVGLTNSINAPEWGVFRFREGLSVWERGAFFFSQDFWSLHLDKSATISSQTIERHGSLRPPQPPWSPGLRNNSNWPPTYQKAWQFKVSKKYWIIAKFSITARLKISSKQIPPNSKAKLISFKTSRESQNAALRKSLGLSIC